MFTGTVPLRSRAHPRFRYTGEARPLRRDSMALEITDPRRGHDVAYDPVCTLAGSSSSRTSRGLGVSMSCCVPNSQRSTRGFAVGLTRIELVTSSLSGMRSNRLSYSPEVPSGDGRG